MRFGIGDGEDVLGDVFGHMTPLAPTGAHCVYFPRGSGIARHDLVVGDADIRAVLFVQTLHVINAVAPQNVELEAEAGQVCMPWSGNMAQR